MSTSAPLSPPPSAADPGTPHPFATPEPARYRSGMLVGRGGMGRVTAVFDDRLQREVARKDVPPGHPDALALERRLAREAWITARLDHPGIVAVHDAGTDAAGRPYFTMRLIRGRSLGAALAAGDLDTATLLRHFLAVCQAVAHAHARGVIHRDLKPDNIMLGAFGETQVVDWGVARALDDASAAAAPLDDPSVDLGKTLAGARVGTPAWMSPEQARGEVVAASADVFSLGLVLRAILAAAGPKDAVAPEAAAILARALAPDPAERYPDAGALAADVAAWLDGRRVSAFAYSPLDLARRFYRAFRAPLLIAAGAVATIAVVVVVSFSQAARERDRAQDAEADLLEQRAIEAVQHGARAEAEILAVHTLALRASPTARGVLARFAARAPPRLVAVAPSPACTSARIDPRGLALACLEPGALSLWELAPLSLRWRLDRAFDAVAWLTPDALVASANGADPRSLIDAATASAASAFDERFVVARVRASLTTALADTADALFAWSPGDPQARILPGAPRRAPWAIAAHGRAALTYDEGTRRASFIDLASGAHVALARVDFDADGPMSAALDASAERAAFGTASGALRVVAVADQAALWSDHVTTRALTDVCFSPDGRWLASRDERGLVALHDAASGQRLALPHLPIDELAWQSSSAGPTLVTLGADLRTWSVPAAPEADSYRASAGISALALSRDGRHLALADGRGAVSVFDVTTGAREAFLDGDERAVAKDLAFTRGDRALAIIWPGHFRAASWAFADPAAAPIDLPTTTNFSRVVARADGTLIAAGYGAIMTHIAPDGALAASQIADGGTLLDLAASDDGRSIAHLSSRGSVAVRAADGPERIIAADRAIAIALDATGATLAIAAPGAVARFDARRGDALGAPIAAPSVGLVALALSPDGSRVAAGTLEGRVLVWDAAGALLMDGRAHTQRVSALAFTASGRHLISASWDGTAIRWDLGVLDVPVARLVERVEGAHGLDLAHAMRADLR